MTAPKAVPTALEIVSPAVESISTTRPSAIPFLHNGVYGHVIEGWKSQAALAIRRLAEGVRNSRLAFAEDAELADLCESEFEAPNDLSPTSAVGTATLSRTAGPAVVVPDGFRMRRPARVVDPIPLPDVDVVVEGDTLFSGTSVPVRIRAVRTGAFANTPLTTGLATDLVLSDTPPDPSIAVVSYSLAGGNNGPSDEAYRNYATAFVRGQFGPTNYATVYGALHTSGVRRWAVYDDTATGTSRIYVADSSWGSSSEWASRVKQNVYNTGTVGFGCVVDVDRVLNKIIHVNLTMVVRDAKYLNNTAVLDATLRQAARSYFDDRPDWYTWKLAGLRAAVTHAHRHLLYCSAVSVTDASGNPVSETDASVLSSTPYHFYNTATAITYLPPT